MWTILCNNIIQKLIHKYNYMDRKKIKNPKKHYQWPYLMLLKLIKYWMDQKQCYPPLIKPKHFKINKMVQINIFLKL